MLEIPQTLSLEARIAEQVRPVASPVMYQRWEELLFLHWSMSPERIAGDLPPGLQVDTFAGRAWVGVVPFSMRGVRPRFLPAVKGLSSFPELNLRTYVRDAQGRPGVWFYSLDTPKRLPNWIARTFFHLNYRLARMQVTLEPEGIRYRSELRRGAGWDSPQDFVWCREGVPFEAEAGSLDFFLVERYRLFAYDPQQKALLTGRVHHRPYPLQQVRLETCSKRLFSLSGLSEPEGAPESVLASSGVAVEIFPMEKVA
ncbi:MAG: DUF2071 domain-containing protein [Puniceicoccaceae bacterium]|nr:MAG: DUF2071 domain-containing protein [Puniceicoccaceae bacterium]